MMKVCFLLPLFVFLSFLTARVSCTNGELYGQLLVNDLPHFQTFDSWPQCNYPGTCYEQACPTLLGGWKNGPFHGAPGSASLLDQRDWWIIAGQTSSNAYNLDNPSKQGQPLPCAQLLTGPCFDHTKGDITGNYMYAEATACYGSTFTVYSPWISYTGTGASMSYWYYLYGGAMNDAGFLSSFTISVTSDNGTSWTQLSQIIGSVQSAAGQPWIQQLLTIDSVLPSTPSPSNPIIVQYRFVAVTGGQRDNGDWWQGDMAVDDILFTQTDDGNTTTPYIDPPPPVNNQTVVTPTPAPPPQDTVEGGDGGLSNGAIAGIVVGVIGGLCCLYCLLLLLVLIILLVVSPRKPPSKGGGGGGDDL